MAAIAASAFMFAMCNNNGNIPVESNWEVEYVYSDGAEIAPPAEHEATLAFLKDSRIAGTTGCNRFFGDFTAQEGNLKLENVGSTRMMCPDMAFETAYLGAIANSVAYTVSNDELALKDNNGNITVLLKKIEPVAMGN